MPRRGLPGGAHPASTILSKDEADALTLMSLEKNTPKSELLRDAWNFYRRLHAPLKKLAQETLA